jgi:hypothetical protein
VCAEFASQCDSGDLLEGRGAMGPELHTPNTLLASMCPDGDEGWYHFDGSLERLKVVRDDGTPLAGGKQVRIEATFYAGLFGEVEQLDLYSAANAQAPDWKYIGPVPPLDYGLTTVSTRFILPPGNVQAIRGVYRSTGSASPCAVGASNDHDDLVFWVGQELDTVPPNASLTTPAPGTTLKGTVRLSAAASDNFGVSRVEFYSGGTLLASTASEPFSFSWNTLPVPNGSTTLSVRAYDAVGQVGTSASVPVTIDNDMTPPTIGFTAPAEGATVRDTVTLSVTATDNVRVTRVDFYVGSTKLGSDTTSPFSYSWSTRSFANGPHTLRAVAFDAANNSASTERTATVENDEEPPSVALTQPTSGQTLRGTVTLAATASDNVGVSRVAFFVDGVQVSSDTTAPYSYSYNTRLKANGTWTLLAKAYDARGNEGRSEEVLVRFDNDFTPPTVTVLSPREGETLMGTLNVTAEAHDDEGVTRVALFLDGAQVALASTSPFALSYNTRNKPNGVKVLTVKAYDAVSNVGTSQELHVTFDNDLVLPTAGIVSPASNAAVSGTVTIEAAASDDRGIERVEFYVAGVLKGTDTTAPYTYAWDTSKSSTGTASLTVKAWDVGGNSKTSSAVQVKVVR